MKQITKTVKNRSVTERMEIVCSILKEKSTYYFWVGFYIPQEDFLEIGPSRGSPACARIPFTGVCGKAASSRMAVIVSDVNKFPGHIACDPRSNSEIALLVFDKGGKIIAVFDVESDKIESFDDMDREWLEKILREVFAT